MIPPVVFAKYCKSIWDAKRVDIWYCGEEEGQIQTCTRQSVKVTVTHAGFQVLQYNITWQSQDWISEESAFQRKESYSTKSSHQLDSDDLSDFGVPSFRKKLKTVVRPSPMNLNKWELNSSLCWHNKVYEIATGFVILLVIWTPSNVAFAFRSYTHQSYLQKSFRCEGCVNTLYGGEMHGAATKSPFCRINGLEDFLHGLLPFPPPPPPPPILLMLLVTSYIT